MSIYAYYRVSTQTQAENNGIQMQETVINDYAERFKLTVNGVYTDLAISGTLTDRDGLIDLLNVLKKGDKVLVQNTSRLWRSDDAKVLIRRELQKIGVDVLSVEQPNYSIYTKEPNEYLINSILEILDAYERMQISLKLAKGRRAKVVKGNTKACGTAPYGYKWSDNATIEIDYNNNLIVKEIYEKYIELNSLQKVANYCKEKGYKTSQGNDFSKQAVSLILHNDFYIGVVTHGESKVKGIHTPIIDKDLFLAINKDYIGI